MEKFKYSIRKIAGENQSVMLDLRGTIGPAGAQQLDAVLRVLMRTEVVDLYVNLGDIAYMNSYALGHLVETAKEFREKDRRIIVLNPPEGVRSVMEILGLLSFFVLKDGFDVSELAFERFSP